MERLGDGAAGFGGELRFPCPRETPLDWVQAVPRAYGGVRERVEGRGETATTARRWERGRRVLNSLTGCI